jgi:plasmid stability protein
MQNATNLEGKRMPTMTIKGIPDDVYQRLKQSAAEHRRSLNSEVIVRLERSLGRTRADVTTVLSRIDALRKELSIPPLTEDFLRKAKSEGRP